MLLPTLSRQIRLHEEGPNMRVTYRDRYWSFPRDECVLLPVANTTAELLGRLHRGPDPAGNDRTGLEAAAHPAGRGRRSFGQSAEVEWHRDEPALPG